MRDAGLGRRLPGRWAASPLIRSRTGPAPPGALVSTRRMIKLMRRFWTYVTAGANQKFNEKADPKIQPEQAIDEAQRKHRRLTEQAANVIAQQKLTESRLNRAMEQLEKLNANARQAIIMAEEAGKAGDATKAGEYTQAAETIANQLDHHRGRGRGAQGAWPSPAPRRPTRPRRPCRRTACSCSASWPSSRSS